MSEEIVVAVIAVVGLLRFFAFLLTFRRKTDSPVFVMASPQQPLSQQLTGELPQSPQQPPPKPKTHCNYTVTFLTLETAVDFAKTLVGKKLVGKKLVGKVPWQLNSKTDGIALTFTLSTKTPKLTEELNDLKKKGVILEYTCEEEQDDVTNKEELLNK